MGRSVGRWAGRWVGRWVGHHYQRYVVCVCQKNRHRSISAAPRYALRNDLRAFHFATPNIRNKISINTESVSCIIKNRDFKIGTYRIKV